MANPQPKRPNVSIINELRKESDIDDIYGSQEGKSFAWDLEKPLSDFGEHLQNASLKNEGSKELKDDSMSSSRHPGPNSPALYGMDINFNNILGDLSSGDRSKMGAGSAPPTLENNSEEGYGNSDFFEDFTFNGATKMMHVPLKGGGMGDGGMGPPSHFSNGRNSADIIADGRGDQSFFGDSIFDSTDKAKSMSLNSFMDGGGVNDRLQMGSFDAGRSGTGHRESKSSDNLDSAFYGATPGSFVRSNSAPMGSLDEVGNPWFQDHQATGGKLGGMDHTFGNGTQDSVFSPSPGIGSDVVLPMSIPLQGASPMATGKSSAYSGASSPTLSEHSNSLNIDLENLPLPPSAPQGSVEALIMQGCAEILIEASSHSLKAVELANTLRARVRQTFLAQIRERWGGLLALLEQATRVFRVRRIPKNDTVALVMPGDSDSDSSPRSRQGSRDGLSDSEKDSFGRSPSHAYSSGSEGEDGGSRTKEHASRCLHVGNVPAQLTEEQLCREFEKFGEVEGLKIVAHRSRRFAFVTFVTIEHAISAKQRLVKLAPWKSAISYAHKESIAPPQPPKNYVPGDKQGGYKIKGAARGGPNVPSGTPGVPQHFKGANSYANGPRSPFDKMGGNGFVNDGIGGQMQQMDFMSGSSLMGGGVLLSSDPHAPPGMMIPAAPFQPQAPVPDMNTFGYDAFPAMDASSQQGLMGGGAAPMQRQQQPPMAPQQRHLEEPGPMGVGMDGAYLGTTEVDPILRRLCDSTFVPTRDWPTDSKDQFYCSAIIQQLQHFHGYTSISKLRSALKGRLMSNDNIKSVPLKALLAAYPQYFVVRGNQVSLNQR